jgi:gluconokinase
MGVSGSGKSTVGAALAGALRWPFYDGDKFHSQANIDKMAAGLPLTDEDRDPWLERIHKLIADKFAEGHSLVVACSALKEAYRLKLRGDLKNVKFVYLSGDYETIYARMQVRPDHYMKPEMLQSQFADLEVPEKAVVVDVRKKLEDEVVDALLGLALSV